MRRAKAPRRTARNCRDSWSGRGECRFNVFDGKLVVESDWDVTIFAPFGMRHVAMIEEFGARFQPAACTRRLHVSSCVPGTA